MKKILLTFILAVMSVCVSGQQYIGSEGLLHVPTADMDTVGIARVGVHYVPKSIIPDKITIDGEKFNSWTNYLSITPFRWIQIGYGYTLWKFHKDKNPSAKIGFYAKDRYFSLKLQLLKEDKWWPSVAIGGNDVWGSNDEGKSGSNYYKNYFVTVSKHLDVGGNKIGAHVSYRRWKRDFNEKWNGVVGGVTIQPSFYQPLRVMCEWDGSEANIGADCRLFKYFLLQCGLVKFKYPTVGLCLYIPLLSSFR